MLNESSRLSINNSNPRRTSGSHNRRSSERPKGVKKPIEEKGTNIQVVLRCRYRLSYFFFLPTILFHS